MNILFNSLQRSGSHAIIEWWLSHFDNYIFHNNCEPATLFPAQIEHKGKPSYQNVLFSLENRSLSNFFNFSAPDIDQKAIIIREGSNWLASIWNYPLVHPQHLDINDLISLYVEYGEFCLENPKYLVKFDEFIKNEQYRRRIEERFNLEKCDDSSLEKISDYGMGSSFSGIDISVTERWKLFINNCDYRLIIKRNKEFVEVSRKLFGNFEKELL